MSIWPPIVLILLMAVDIDITIAKAGEPRGKYHPGYALVGIAITCAILYWGGFFAPLLP